MKCFCKKITILFILIFFSTNIHAQIDSIRFSKDQLVVGEIKSMNKGVLVVKTDFSDSDFEIEWREVKWIVTQTSFFIMLSYDQKYYGTISMTGDSLKMAVVNNEEKNSFNLTEVVYLDAFNDKFKDRFNAELSVGLDMAKSRNLRSLSSRGKVGYKAKKWFTDFAINALVSDQDSTEQIRRLDSELNYLYLLKHRLYGIASVSTLSNTEQKLDLRLNIQLGAGRFFVHTNKVYLGAKLGLNRNLERYSNETDERSSWEGFVGTDLNLFGMGDIDLLFSLMAYPGITEFGRFRTDVRLDLKYDLPLHFFIKIGTSINFDNQPAENASRTDYVLQATFGWEWD